MEHPKKELIEDFVRNSNAIEGYTEKTVRKCFNIPYRSSPHYKGHMMACEHIIEAAAAGKIADINKTHGVLMFGMSKIDPGSIQPEEIGAYRRCYVTVGGRRCPKPHVLHGLMEGWKKAAQLLLAAPERAPDARAERCLELHHWFECIHPFRDGNGRIGRLLWNNLRLVVGLDWGVIAVKNREEYYAGIRRWQESKWEAIAAER